MHIPMVFLVRNRENQESQPIVEGLGSIPGLSQGPRLDSWTQPWIWARFLHSVKGPRLDSRTQPWAWARFLDPVKGLGSIPGLSHGPGLDSWTQSRAWALGSRAHIDGLEIIGIADRNGRQYGFAL